jgi:peptide/nickel transport system substrate-binding protein
MNTKPVGTGPWKVVNHNPGKSLLLERNTDYFKDSPKGTPKIGKLEMRFIPDRQTQMAEMLSGNMDLIMNVAKDQADQAGRVPQLQVVSGETMRIVFLQMNTLDGAPAPQLKDIRVRKAIAHAIDRESIVKNIVGAGARVLHTVCFPSQFGCTDEGAPRYNYDPALAKRLLAEAGFPNGFDTEIFAYRERNQTEAMIGNLQAVGIRAKLTFSQYAAMRDQVRANKSALSHQTWGSFSVNDVSASTPVYFTFQADDISRDPEIRDLLLKGDNSVDPAVRKSAYRDALRLISERLYAVPLWSLPVYYVASKDLSFSPYPDEMVRFWEMSWK